MLGLLGSAPGTLWGHPPIDVPTLEPDEARARREAFLDHLARRGWEERDGHVGPTSAAASHIVKSLPASSSFRRHRATLFLNFWGVPELRPGTNAALDESTCVPTAMPWPGFEGTEAEALRVVEIVRERLSPYGIRVVHEERPPAHLPYAMVLFGGTPELIGAGPGVLGTSCSSDCYDRWGRDTTLVFSGARNTSDTEALAITALHEAAHAFGLTHVDDPARIMYPFVSHGAVWGDGCAGFDTRTGPILCRDSHLELCADGQNAHAELLAMFGADSADTHAPIVRILEPLDGVEIPPGGGVTVVAEIEDDYEGFGWKLAIPELHWEAVAYRGERTWPLTGLPVGAHTLRVEAIDHDRNVGFDEVRIYVGVPPGTPSPLDPPEDDDANEGCTCGMGPSGGGAGLLLLVAGLLGRRRRQRCG